MAAACGQHLGRLNETARAVGEILEIHAETVRIFTLVRSM
jgi:hypothetical protein